MTHAAPSRVPWAWRLAWLGALAAAGCGPPFAREAAPPEPPPPPPLVPTVKRIEMERVPEGSRFRLDEQVVVLVSSQASRGTRRAARVLQLGLRRWLGLDPPIVRIVHQPRLEPGSKAIWIIEPRLERPPDHTIGVDGLEFTRAMREEGYFIRVDPMEVVLHGATDAASAHAAHTLLQLIQPGRPGSLLRAARPPWLPCLWAADWPAHPVRALPEGWTLPTEAEAVPAFLQTLARYKLNALPRAALPQDPAARERAQQWAGRLFLQVVDAAPALPRCPLADAAAAWWKEPATRGLALAAAGELGWTSPAPAPAEWRPRVERAIARLAACAEKAVR